MKLRSPPRKLLILAGRFAWIGVTALALALMVVSISSNLQYISGEPLFVTMSNYAAPDWVSRGTLAAYFAVLRYLALLVFFLMGFLVFYRRSHNWIGLVTAFVLVLLPSTLLRFGGYPDRWELPGVWYQALVTISWFLAFLGGLSATVFLYIFPDGKCVPRPLWIAPPLITLIGGAALLFTDRPDNWAWLILSGVSTVIFLIGLAGQVARYRRSSLVTRQQIRWVLTGLLTFPAWILIHWALELPDYSVRLRGVFSLILLHGDILVPTLLPVALAVATLRHRLWDIDLVIRRTLVWGTLSVLLGTMFYAGVILFQRVFTGISGEESPLALVASTLAIAALFSPIRHKVQDIVDRRFYRSKYDAQQVLARFATIARDETDLEKLTGGLAGAVSETVQPDKVAVWLRKS